MRLWWTLVAVEAPSADAAEAAVAAHGEVLDCYPAPVDEWGEDPDHPREDWAYEAANGDTSLGYWAWAARERAEDEDDGD
jgi:hypothetical protein